MNPKLDTKSIEEPHRVLAEKESIKIRTATLQDKDDLLQVSSQAFAETFREQNTEEDLKSYLNASFNPEKMAKEFEEPNVTFLLAEYNGQLAGYAKLHTVENPSELAGRKHIELERIYALKAFQGKKIGKELMTMSIDIAKRNNFDVLWLGVWEHNVKAIEFYKKWGFERFSQHDFYLGTDKQLDHLMKLELK